MSFGFDVTAVDLPPDSHLTMRPAGVDPTNDIEAGLRHVRVTPGDALPTLDSAVVAPIW